MQQNWSQVQLAKAILYTKWKKLDFNLHAIIAFKCFKIYSVSKKRKQHCNSEAMGQLEDITILKKKNHIFPFYETVHRACRVSLYYTVRKCIVFSLGACSRFLSFKAGNYKCTLFNKEKEMCTWDYGLFLGLFYKSAVWLGKHVFDLQVCYTSCFL